MGFSVFNCEILFQRIRKILIFVDCREKTYDCYNDTLYNCFLLLEEI